ncbi:JAB domain-containing protein [Arcicella lustrica]|uniref:JAB domain-containing protein n=1 Tax=Arcicella lustrica TaxID=2984196 RepID=A0ABU5SGI1_9BACT|nr:JAB domain-containing protein [Arcicella sp. DC25W]MEA5426395.1 JAB domain-containing protein [Arcicella sp. DC25W]
MSEIEIIYKNKTPYHDRLKIDAPWVAYDVLHSTWDAGKIELLEQFKIMLLDHRCNCLGISEVGSGGMSGVIIDTKIVFATALQAKANRLILAHNHPSGVLEPSDADILMTRRMVKAGQILDLPVVDHLIVTPHGYYSFSENGHITGWEKGHRLQTPLP